MTPAVDAIKIEEYTVPERLELLDRIWDSLVNSSDPPPMPEWHGELLDQRIADADANPNDAIPLDQLQAYLGRAK